MQTVQSIDYAHHAPVTREGQATLYALKCAVFGDAHLADNVLELVAFGSMTRVRTSNTCIGFMR